MSHDKLELIAKLLAKAESTTPEEAEALTEHAERLMLKYGIEQARIDAARGRLGETQEEVVQEHLRFTGTYARDMRELAAYVGHGLGGIRMLQSEHPRGGSVLHYVGFRSDVQQAKLLTNSLQVQAMVAMRQWWAAERDDYLWHTEGQRRSARSGFLRGFASGVGSRIAESRRVVMAEAGSGTDVVLAERKDRMDAVADALSDGRRARRRGGTDLRAYQSGHVSGRQANTGQRDAVPAGRSS